MIENKRSNWSLSLKIRSSPENCVNSDFADSFEKSEAKTF
jgi:hypothetical protein